MKRIEIKDYVYRSDRKDAIRCEDCNYVVSCNICEPNGICKQDARRSASK